MKRYQAKCNDHLNHDMLENYWCSSKEKCRRYYFDIFQVPITHTHKKNCAVNPKSVLLYVTGVSGELEFVLFHPIWWNHWVVVVFGDFFFQEMWRIGIGICTIHWNRPQTAWSRHTEGPYDPCLCSDMMVSGSLCWQVRCVSIHQSRDGVCVEPGQTAFCLQTGQSGARPLQQHWCGACSQLQTLHLYRQELK